MKKIILNTVKTTSVNYKKYSALVDDEDFERVSKHNWYIYKAGNVYAATNIKYKAVNRRHRRLCIHRLITGFKVTDHINGNGLDNRRSNLREVTVHQNTMNRRGKAGVSKFKGVYWKKETSKWCARIGINYKRIHLGYFQSEIEAAKAYNTAAKKYFGEYAYLNKFLRKATND